MALTNIGAQKTPGRPIEITFAAETGVPADTQELLLVGRAASGITPASGLDIVQVISNIGSVEAASGEAAAKYGASSEIAQMIVAAAIALEGKGAIPIVKAVALASDATDIGSTALAAIKKTKAEFIAVPFDGNSTTPRDTLKDLASVMSGPQRVSNNQYGTMGVMLNRSVTDASNLFQADTQYLILMSLPDTGTGDEAPAYSLGQACAAMAAEIAASSIPFNPKDSVTVQGVDAPAKQVDWISVGAGLESEAILNRGWTPLYVKPNGEVAFVRTVTSRLTVNAEGTVDVTAYYDVQDFQVLYFWRKTVYARLSQSDFTQVKASAGTAVLIKSELIRLAVQFQEQEMFQAVQQLAKFFIVERNASDRSRFDVKTPVNVIPGLHVIAVNVEATTQFDTITV